MQNNKAANLLTVSAYGCCETRCLSSVSPNSARDKKHSKHSSLPGFSGSQTLNQLSRTSCKNERKTRDKGRERDPLVLMQFEELTCYPLPLMQSWNVTTLTLKWRITWTKCLAKKTHEVAKFKQTYPLPSLSPVLSLILSPFPIPIILPFYSLSRS